MGRTVPFVEYLKPGSDPHLVAHECPSCGAPFLDSRNACACCFGLGSACGAHILERSAA